MDNRKEKVRDLVEREAVAKMRELVKHNNICLFTTNLYEIPLKTRPMAVREVDDEGNFWFISSRTSEKNIEVDEDPGVQLFFANRGDSEFLTVYGEAEAYSDRDRIRDLWTPIANAWFEAGKDDPDATVIKVSPRSAYYWDTLDGKMVTLFRIVSSMLGADAGDGGVQGELKVRS